MFSVSISNAEATDMTLELVNISGQTVYRNTVKSVYSYTEQIDASSFAKGVITSPDTLHICYCHTPTRYVWSDTHQYINELKYNKYFKKILQST